MTKAAIAVWTGAVGTLLFAALFVAAAVRLRVHMRRRAGHTPVFRRCHAVIVVFAALDIPRYLVTLIREEPVEFQSGLLARVVYAAHLCSTWLQVVALTMIILMWATVFHGKGRNMSSSGGRSAAARCRFMIRAGFMFMNVVLLVATIVVVVPLVAVDTGKRLDATLDHEETYFPFVVMSSVCLFVCALGIMVYGIKMHFKIAEFEWRAASLPVVRRLLRSFNFTMGVCTVMFALRIAMLLSLFSKSVRDNAALNEFEWQLLSYWLPTIVSATVLLVFMKAGPQSGSTAVRRRSRKYLVGRDPSLYPGAGPLIEEHPGQDSLDRAYGHAVTYDSMATSPLRAPPVTSGRKQPSAVPTAVA